MTAKHPTYAVMVKEAIEAIGKPGKGASRQGIKKHLKNRYGLLTDSKAVKTHIASAIKKGCEIKEFHTPDGLSGRVKLMKSNNKAKPSAAAKAKAGKKKEAADDLLDSESEAEEEAADNTGKRNGGKRGSVEGVGAASDEEEQIDMTSELDEEDQKPALKKAKPNGQAKVQTTGGSKAKTATKKAVPKAVKASAKTKSSAATSSSSKASTTAAPKKTTKPVSGRRKPSIT